jgi:hypothetical protein
MATAALFIGETFTPEFEEVAVDHEAESLSMRPWTWLENSKGGLTLRGGSIGPLETSDI